VGVVDGVGAEARSSHGRKREGEVARESGRGRTTLTNFGANATLLRGGGVGESGMENWMGWGGLAEEEED
jgi:hypothetical protein